MNFQTWKCKGQQYVAVDNGDGWHIIREDGENYGAWRKPEAFRKLQRDNDPNGFLGLPGSAAKLAVRVGPSEQWRDDIGDPGVHDVDPAGLNKEDQE